MEDKQDIAVHGYTVLKPQYPEPPKPPECRIIQEGTKGELIAMLIFAIGVPIFVTILMLVKYSGILN